MTTQLEPQINLVERTRLKTFIPLHTLLRVFVEFTAEVA